MAYAVAFVFVANEPTIEERVAAVSLPQLAIWFVVGVGTVTSSASRRAVRRRIAGDPRRP